MDGGTLDTDHKCFALTPNNKCRILNVVKCSGNTCAFYKTMEQQSESCKKVYARLASLSPEKQIAIAEKYYGGKMLW